MQHCRAHEGKLAKLGVGYLFDRLGVIDDAGISHKYTGYVRPVFVHIGIYGNCRK